MSGIKISVIIPIFNMEQYLEECIFSVQKQSLKEIEIICINDGSTDNSQYILDKFAGADNRIKVIHQANAGVANARNLGMKSAVGKYVAFMDPDDYYPDPDVLESLYTAAEKHNVSVSGGCFSYLNPDGSITEGPDVIGNEELYWGYYFERSELLKYSDYQFDYGFHRFIYNRDFLLQEKVLFPLLKRFQDPPFMVEALTKANEFYAINKTVYRYRGKTEEVKWTPERISDLLDGLFLNIRWAEKNNFDGLYQLTTVRLLKEYRDVLGQLPSLVREQQRELIRIRKSYSYNIGLLLTYIPRKIIHLLISGK